MESVFTVPGIGRFFTTSALNRDYPMIMAMAMMIAVLWGVMYLISDVLYAVDRSARPAGRQRSVIAP